jgi:hypothetical protein
MYYELLPGLSLAALDVVRKMNSDSWRQANHLPAVIAAEQRGFYHVIDQSSLQAKDQLLSSP